MPIDTAPLPPFPADTPPQHSDTSVCPYCIICFLNPRIRFRITEGSQILCAETAYPTSCTHRCLLQFTYLLLLMESAALSYLHIFLLYISLIWLSSDILQPSVYREGGLLPGAKVCYLEWKEQLHVCSRKKKDADTMDTLRYHLSPSSSSVGRHKGTALFLF